MPKTGQEFERFKEMGRRDVQTALRLMLLRDMLHHRNLTRKAVAKQMVCTSSWLNQLLSGAAWYRISVPRHDEWLDQVEDAITVLTDHQGGVYGQCKCDPTSIEGIREVLGHANYYKAATS